MKRRPRDVVQRCVECGRAWLNGRERWRAYLVDLDELAFYCPACAAREFGG